LRRREPRLSTDPLTVWIGTIAELTPNKNLSFLIEALARLPDDNWQAVIIGEGEERQALTALIARHHLASKVFLLGFMSEAARYLKALDLFTLTSLKEGLPYVVLEAAAAGLPVIATRVGGLPDLITSEQTGRLISSGDTSALRETLLELLRDHRLRLELGDTIHTALAPLTQQAMAEQTILLYTKSN
jgi:glycosyltransferase involved in cell wall biosynthesis